MSYMIILQKSVCLENIAKSVCLFVRDEAIRQKKMFCYRHPTNFFYYFGPPKSFHVFSQIHSLYGADRSFACRPRSFCMSSARSAYIFVKIKDFLRCSKEYIDTPLYFENLSAKNMSAKLLERRQ